MSLLKIRKYDFVVVVLLLIGYLLLLNLTNLSKIGRTLTYSPVPKAYTSLMKFLDSQNDFFRTFWVPQRQRFGFLSDTHPAIWSSRILNVSNISEILKFLEGKDAERQLENLSVKYVIIPFDSEKELFLTDRKFDIKRYQEIIYRISKIPYLKGINGFGEIKVFQTRTHKDHFYLTTGQNLPYKRISSSEYIVDISQIEKEDIVFSEKYSSGWVAYLDGEKISSGKYERNLNSFKVKEKRSNSLEVFYEPQKFVDIGSFISVSTLVVCIGCIILIKKKSLRNSQ